MGPSGKWIDGLSPDNSVVDAARASLSARLTAVAHWLPLAAYHAAQDVEHVHRLRVSTRRAVAALRLYRDWLPARKFRWVKKRLKKIRRAAGEARDLDVLAHRIECELGERAAPYLTEVRQLREAAQPAIVQIAERCRRSDRFVRKIGKLLDGVRPPKSPDQSQLPPSFRSWAQGELRRTAEQFFSATPPAADADNSALHQYRIRGKAVRYAIELLAPAFSPELREVHYPVVEELQQRLGKIQDCVTGAARLRELARTTGSPDNCQTLGELAGQQDAALTQSIAGFHEWWTPDRIDGLRRGLLMNDQTAVVVAETPAEPQPVA